MVAKVLAKIEYKMSLFKSVLIGDLADLITVERFCNNFIDKLKSINIGKLMIWSHQLYLKKYSFVYDYSLNEPKG